MKIVIAIDSFKGSMSTLVAGEAVKEGIKRVYPDAEAVVCPLADGGEGTVRAIYASLGAELVRICVTGPLGEPVEAEYAYRKSDGLAIMEMASAAGLPLVPEDRRDPRYTTTYGVGEMIRDAITRHGCRKFIIGIGGSATNDGGAGMLSALGYAFTDKEGMPVKRGAVGLAEIESIDTSMATTELAECEFHVACDVKNPLLGEMGASRVFAPQKGATPETVEELERLLTHYAKVSREVLGHDYSSHPGAGAAGGLGFALVGYLRATLEPGIDIVMNAVGLEEMICDADIVVTGEGRLDGQSAMGKAPVGVATLAKRYGKPTIAFAGALTPDATALHAHGIDALFPIQRSPITLEEAMNTEVARQNLADTSAEVFRLIKAIKSN